MVTPHVYTTYPWGKPTIDEAATQLARNLFDDFNESYMALGQFRGKLATEIERVGQDNLRRSMEAVDGLISAAQDDLDRAVEKLRQMAPGTLLVTLGRKPHYLPGR